MVETVSLSPAVALVLVLLAMAPAAMGPAAMAAPQRGDVLWANRLDSAQALAAGNGPGAIVADAVRGAVLEVSADATAGNAGVSRSFTLPVDTLRGAVVSLAVDVKAEGVSAKPQAWNGIKAMAHIDTPGGPQWPQADIPAGTFDWKRFSTRLTVPADATAVTLVLGLERVSGKVWFSDARVTFVKSLQPAPPAPPDQPIWRGHNLPRLRGAMIQTNLSEADLRVLAQDWGANLVRWQLTRPNPPAGETDFAPYDKWLDGELVKLDRGLTWAHALGVKVVVDLHSPPGGKGTSGGYQAALGGIFTDPAAQAKFVEVWRDLTTRYKGNGTIWGFDLVNEPVDNDTAEGCSDWQELALRAGTAVRAIDPERTLIVEPPDWGGPQGFVGFNPIPLPHVVYSFHMYQPMQFTHQGVFGPSEPVSYPGVIAGKQWDKAALQAAIAPATEFARRYRVHMYVGEFSAIRWAPGADRYLSDLIDILEAHGWDWSYHAFREWDGWSVEHSPDKNDHARAAAPTARQLVLLKWLRQDQRAF